MIIGTNFKLSSAKFLDDRQLCKDYDTLIANVEGIIYPPGFEVFCEYENKYYQYVSDTNGGYIWEERKSGISDGTSASIKDDTISEEYTWSSAHIDSMRIDLETLITQANDYVDEIDERMLYIEGKFQWFEYFDGSYESLKDKPTIPTKISELEDDNEIMIKLEGKVDIEEGKTLIDVQELNRLSNIEQYDDTEIKNRLLTVEANSHTHNNGYIIDSITEEMINQWNEMGGGVEDYNYLINKPIIRIGEDPDLVLNVNDLNNKGVYIVNGIIDGERFAEELCATQLNDSNTMITLIMLNSMKKVVLQRDEKIEEEWHIIKVENYGIDKNNAKIIDTLTIGEDKIILDKEGNGWYGGKVSQEGIPTEDKDLVTKGYVDNKFATNERVSAIEKENARRDVIIEALANGRRRTVETDGNDVDLMFSTEKDKVWIDKIEGDTMVNVCDQEEPIAITKSYTVEGTNHVPLQGEYDGKARPVVHGNTLVNHNVEYDKSIIIGEKIDNRQGIEILNLEGTPGCEIKVDIDGHTAINLSTKKEDILCKSFDSASGNEINLVAEENSVSDLVIQGNTMVNLCRTKINYTLTNEIVNNFESVVTNEYDTYYEYVCTNSLSESNLQLIKWDCKLVYPLENGKTYTYVLPNNIPQDTSFNRYNIHYNNINYYKEGELNLIPFTVNQIEDTFGTNFYFYSIYSDIPAGVNRTIRMPKWIMIFEGDLTQTPELIPTEYVEGLQSTFEDKLIPYSIYNGSQLTSITETQYQLPLTVEVGKTYTITTTANVGTTENHKYQYGVYSADGLTNYLEYESCSPTQTFVCDKANILFKVRMHPSYSGDDYSFTLSEVQDKFLIVEGDWTDRLDLLTEEYFGKYRVDMMSSCGKNLIDIKSPTTHYFAKSTVNNNTITVAQTTDNYFGFCRFDLNLKENTKYTFTGILVENDINTARARLIDLEGLVDLGILYDGTTITTPSKKGNFSLLLYIGFDEYISAGQSATWSNIQLEEGAEATEYEPYCGTSKTIYLNSPLLNGDELLTKDGKLCHYHKMGMVVLDGSEDEKWAYGTAYAENILPYIRFYTQIDNCLVNSYYICDKFSFASNNMAEYLGEGIGNYANLEFMQVNINSTKLSTTDINGFKQWLSENPTTVVYELAEPWYEPIGAYGKVVLDGSEDEGWTFNHSSSISHTYYVRLSNFNSTLNPNIVSDRFSYIGGAETIFNNTQGFKTQPSYSNVLYLCLNNITSVEAVKQYLQQNPVTVIYQLERPQPINEDMRFNIASTSTIEYQSSVPMANTTFLPYRNELPLLESSTQYRVTFDCDVEGLELMVSLGGTSQTITSGLHNELSFITPSLQTDGKLTIDGCGIAKIDNVLITSGDMEYEYFEGLESGFEDGYIPNSTHIEFSHLELGNINSNTGENISNTIIVRTPLLTTTSDKLTFVIVNANYTLHKVVLYDSEGNFVTGNTELINGMKLGVVTVLEGCSQFRLCLNASDVSAINQSNLLILEGDWTHLTEEDFNHLGKYKTTIRIQNPNAPIFGKGGRL